MLDFKNFQYQMQLQWHVMTLNNMLDIKSYSMNSQNLRLLCVILKDVNTKSIHLYAMKSHYICLIIYSIKAGV